MNLNNLPKNLGVNYRAANSSTRAVYDQLSDMTSHVNEDFQNLLFKRA